MSLIEILRVLYDSALFYDPENPTHPDRDRLILSKGHGCIALYVLLADKGFFPSELLPTFCRFDSILGGHPERSHVPGVEASTGSLGHGLSVGVGMAFASRILKRENKVVVVVGDGELDEGSIWEAALSAGHHRLENLTVVVDFNGLQSYGRVEEIWQLEPLGAKWEAFGFDTYDVDGHDVTQLEEVFLSENVSGRPKAVIARTVKGKGISFAENNASWHHKAKLSFDDVAELRQALIDA